MKRRLARVLLRWLGYRPPRIVVPRGSSVVMTIRGAVELHSGGWGGDDAPLFDVEGDFAVVIDETP